MPDTKYLRAMFGAARVLGLSDDDLRDMAGQVAQTSSLRALSDAQAAKILDQLNRQVAGIRRDPMRRDAQAMAGRRGDRRKVEYPINDRDRQLLRDVAALRGWGQEVLDKFIARQLRGREMRSMADLNKVLWAIKSMNRRDGLVGPNDRPIAK